MYGIDKNEILSLSTERSNKNSEELHKMSLYDVLKTINNEDKYVAYAVEKELDSIERVVEVVVNAFNNGGRLIYIGAGTSGRLGVLDASECPPTFSVDPEMVKGIIAGGYGALVKSSESVEDSEVEGEKDLKEINLNSNDVVIGLVASGRTPYVVGAVKYANSIGCKTASVVCNKNSKVGKISDIAIEVYVGPEVLSGSTRMKSGTAQKMVLNMITTSSMVMLGKVYKNFMVDMKSSNEKLKIRALNIVLKATGVDEDTAKEILVSTDWNIKESIVMILLNVDRDKAIKYLSINNNKINI